MRKLLEFLRGLFSRNEAPRDLPPAGGLAPAPPPSEPSERPVQSETQRPVLRPVLLVGDDLAWLRPDTLLASRPIVLAGSAAQPLALLSARPSDLLVASYTDPQRSIALLQSAAAASPSTIGVLRASQKELGTVRPAFPMLPRVDSAEVLDDQLRTRLAAAKWEANPATASLLRKFLKLPTLPAIYTQITAALQKDDAPVDEIAALVAQEPAVSAKLLQLANSPIFGMRERVTSTREATSLLGLSRLRSLVLATCLFRQFDDVQAAGFSMASFEETSLRAANRAATITLQETGDIQMAEMAFTAGLLHKFGMLLLATNLPEEYRQVLQESAAQGIEVEWGEIQTFGVSNSEIAGGTLASWGLPFPIVNAVGWSAAPSSSEDTAFTPLTAVHTAMTVESFIRTGMYNHDRAYMERLQFEPRLLYWCDHIAQLQTRVDEPA